MKIHSYKTNILKIPLNKPMKTRHLTLHHVYGVLLTLQTEDNIQGQGLVRAPNKLMAQFINKAISELFSTSLLNLNLNEPEAYWHSLWTKQRNHLQSSFPLYALATIDFALWDIYAKSLNQPLHQLLNTQQTYAIPYGNGAWLEDTDDEIIQGVEWYFIRGTKNFKMRIGGPKDEHRIKLLCKTFGDELKLAADANQYYTFEDAVSTSQMLADYGVIWFEEPLISSSLTELQKLAQLSPLPIASGENMNSHWEIQDLCELRAAQIIQPDPIYQGGITEFIRSAKIIEQFQLTLSAHLFQELSCSLVGLCSKNYLEHIDFFPADLFLHDFSIKEGKIQIPTFPGHGATVAQEAIEKYIDKEK